MPAERFYIRTTVDRDRMCDFAPRSVQNLMDRLVHTVSPNWATVRLEIIEGPMHDWDIRLSGEGVPRG